MNSKQVSILSYLLMAPICVVLLAPLFAAGSFPQAQQDAEQEQKILKADPAQMKKVFKEFQGQNGTDWLCQWDPKTGFARQIRGGRTLVVIADGDPVRTSQIFIESNRKLFGLTRPFDTIRHVKTRGMLNGKSVQFEQRYKGVPVWPTRIITLLDAEGGITQVSSSAWPIGEVATTPGITRKDARRAIARSHGTEVIESPEKAQLVIYAQGTGVLAWKSFDFVGEAQEPWEHVVDATTGELLQRKKMSKSQQQSKPSSKDEKVKKRVSNPPDQVDLPFGPGAPPDPCDREWIVVSPTPADVVLDSVLTPDYSYWMIIDVGATSNGATEDDSQTSAIYGAGITLLPGIEYSIEVIWSADTWDSYNTDTGNGGHWDVFFTMINSTGFFWDVTDGSPIAECSCSENFVESSPIGPGQLWTFGGSVWGDNNLCSQVNSRTYTYKEDDLSKTVFLSLGLDTGRTGSVDGVYPSWGRYVVTITADTPYFNPNPSVALNDTTLEDDNDSHESIEMNGYAIRETALPHLTTPAPAAPYTLTGDFCTIAELAAPTIIPPLSHNGKFPFLRGCDGFEAVNSYLHITEFQLYLQSLGYTEANGNVVNAAADGTYRSIQVDPHYSLDDQSQYVPDGNGRGRLQFGDGGVDDAEDADVIVHEYSHSCFDNIHVGILFGNGGHDSDDPGTDPDTNETWALDESFCDFFASHYFSDESAASGFDPAVWAEWDAAPSATGLRRLNLDLVYPADLTGVYHTDSQVFSRALWDLRTAIGGDRVVKYVIESVKVLPDDPTFTDMVLAMLSVDVDPFTEGPNPDAGNIKAVFENRGVLRRLRIRAEDEAGNGIVGMDVQASHADIDGQLIDTVPFDYIHVFSQDLSLTAPVVHNGRNLVGWKFNGGPIQPGSPGVLILNQNAIPIDGFLATAVYESINLGDFNNDGIINGADLGLLIALFGSPAANNPEYDLNNDGLIDGGDVGLLLANWSF